MKIQQVKAELLYAKKTDKRTDREDEADSRIPQFCERDQMKENCLLACIYTVAC